MASGPPTTGSGSTSGGGNTSGRSSNRSAEFKKRIHQFEGAGMEEGLFEPPLVEQSARARKLREMMTPQSSALMEPGLDFSSRSHRSGSTSSSRESSVGNLKSPTPASPSWASVPYPSMPHLPAESAQERQDSRVSAINGQRFIDDDDGDGLSALGGGGGVGRPHPSLQQRHSAASTTSNTSTTSNSSSQQQLTIGEETGQKERVVVPYNTAMPPHPHPHPTPSSVPSSSSSLRSTPASHVHTPSDISTSGGVPMETGSSPLLMSGQPDDSEKDDLALSQQINLLEEKNRDLQEQLEEREQERDRLREQLERADKGPRGGIYSPPGLPSRVLDGRKVLRDSVPFVTSPGIPCPMSPLLPGSPVPPRSPLPLHSPHIGGSSSAGGRGSPRPLPPRTSSPLTPSAADPTLWSRPPIKDYSTTSSSKRPLADDFVMPRATEAITSDQFLRQQIDTLKRSNLELEKRLLELNEDKRKIETELKTQKENFSKMQAREQDLLKDIDILRDENSHHATDIKWLQSEREELKNENESLHDDLDTITDKLNKTEKCYKDVEHENLMLEAEIKQLAKEKKLLAEEKSKLQLTVEDDVKSKEIYRATIKKLREQNQSLERQPEAKAPKPEKKKVPTPANKVQQVIDLRFKKQDLQDRLQIAQQDIDSFQAHLNVQEKKDASSSSSSSISSSDGLAVEGGAPEMAAHLTHFRTQVETVRADLDAVQNTISQFSSQQQALVHESFLLLMKKCREQILSAGNNKAALSEALEMTKHSLAKIESDYDILRCENSKLLSQKSSMQAEITSLKSEISLLQDQKRMQSAQIAQSEAIAKDKDKKLSEVETNLTKLQERYSISEKNWKREHGKLELEYEGRLAEARQESDQLLSERESLISERAQLETRMKEITLENENLSLAKDEMECRIKKLEDEMVEIVLKEDRNEKAICASREEIARLLVEKTLLLAKLKLDEAAFEETLAAMKKDESEVLSGALTENSNLKETIDSLLADKSAEVAKRLIAISEKEKEIDFLQSNISNLTTKQDQLQTDMDNLSKRHSKTVHEFRMLEDSEHSRRLENEKVKMTLTTEISLLKSKLASVEDERGRLEHKLSEMGGKGGGEGASLSAFHPVVVGSKQLGESKLQRKQNLESIGNRNAQVVEFQNRLALLEAENQRLKEAIKKAAATPSSSSSTTSLSSLDEEVVTNYRKRITEMTRKTFFLESDKKNLTDKVKTLTTSLKSAREAKEHVTSERVQMLQDENKILRDRVQKLEGNLTRKLMAADSKILETVKENDRLRSKLQSIQSALSSDEGQRSEVESFLSVLRRESEVLQDLKTSLAASTGELDKLELGHQRIEGLQQEIQMSLSASSDEACDAVVPVETSSSATTSPTATTPSGGGSCRTFPAVFKSLPPSYISNLQGEKDGEKLRHGGRSMSATFSHSGPTMAAEIQKKMSEMTSATMEFGQSFQRHKTSLKGKDEEVRTLHDRLVAIETRFKEEAERSKSVKDLIRGMKGLDLRGEQLQAVMQRQIEQLQDQVIDRDSALSDIENQMKADFEMHHKKFTLMKSQVLELREKLSSTHDLLRSKDQYIQKTEDRCLGLEGELFKSRKELERVGLEQKELLRQGLPEGMQIQGASVADIIRIQGDELNQLKKLLRDFTHELSQVQTQLEAVQREKSVLQSKAIEMERMHVQMKEHMGTDINYLRQLNLQLVEQQMKAEKATEILKQVKDAQGVFRKQKDMIKMEAELDASKTKILEQNHRISELEHQLMTQALSLKILHAEKDHSIMLTHHAPPELTNQMSSLHMRPHSAESARKPKYKISDNFKSRGGASGRNINSEFSIVLPSHNSSHGNRQVDILNLEEQPEQETWKRGALSLGPMVVTDDEYSVSQAEVEKARGKPQRHQRLKGHRRTASTGSNIVPFSRGGISGDKDQTTPSSSKGGSNTVPFPLVGGGGGSKQSGGGGGGKLKLAGSKNPKRPGSAGSSRQDVHVRQESRIHDTEEITKTAHELSTCMYTLIDDHSQEDVSGKKSGKNSKDTLVSPTGGRKDVGAGGRSLDGSGSGTLTKSGGGASSSSTSKGKGRFELARNKLANKSTDSNETTSSEGNSFSSKGSSQSDSGGSAGGKLDPSTVNSSSSSRSVEFALDGRVVLEGPRGGGGGVLSSLRHSKTELQPQQSQAGGIGIATDLSRTESMSSTCSTLSIFGNFPSRNHSFTYDGGESSTYSHESLDIGIGDSVENLQALGSKMGPYFTPIMPTEVYTTSSSDEENYRKNRRKKSSTTGDNTPRHKDTTYNLSNSSCDSDTLQQEGGGRKKLADIPAHVNESISISDMDRDTTDIEMEQKAADLKHCFSRGRVRYSSTGSVKICYSESSNTSLEDITKN